MQKTDYRILATRQARERLRAKGQFWTPDWIAEPMIEYVLAGNGGIVFDPAVGAGAFFRAAKVIASENAMRVSLAGMEIDPAALAQALNSGLEPNDLASVTVGDFVLQLPLAKFSAIVANPPYIRHHRLTREKKEQLKRLAIQIIGKPLDGRAGLHVYFLIRALSLLEENGRLAFILSADVCEGKFARDLWSWISSHFCLDAVITFSPEASPFPNVDTNPLIFFIRKSAPQDKFLWVRCHKPQSDALKRWVRSGFKTAETDLLVVERDLDEGLTTGLSRAPLTHCPSNQWC